MMLWVYLLLAVSISVALTALILAVKLDREVDVLVSELKSVLTAIIDTDSSSSGLTDRPVDGG